MVLKPLKNTDHSRAAGSPSKDFHPVIRGEEADMIRFPEPNNNLNQFL